MYAIMDNECQRYPNAIIYTLDCLSPDSVMQYSDTTAVYKMGDRYGT
jgi:hypothetical protein